MGKLGIQNIIQCAHIVTRGSETMNEVLSKVKETMYMNLAELIAEDIFFGLYFENFNDYIENKDEIIEQWTCEMLIEEQNND